LKDAWYDESNTLCWEKTPKEDDYDFYNAAAYCSSLGPGWRLPMIQELISLIDGCESRACGVGFPDCLDSGCADGPDCASCTANANCFWNSTNLEGTCPYEKGYWSQSDVTDQALSVWLLKFRFASVSRMSIHPGNRHQVRCVRSHVGTCNTPINENFNSGSGGFFHYPILEESDNDSWDYAAVSYLDDTVTCHSGEKCWTTEKFGKYESCESAALVSPIIDLSFCDNIELSFWHWYRYEDMVGGKWNDGALVQISNNGGLDWNDVTPSVPYQGNFEGTCHESDYPQANHPVWSGTTAGATWQRVTIPIPGSHINSTFRFDFSMEQI
jgi:hypothetical protein